VGSASIIQMRARSAAGVLGPVQNLTSSTGIATDPDVKMNRAGDAVIVWTIAGRVQVRVRRASGTLLAPQSVSPAGVVAGRGRAAIDGAGRVLAIWEEPGGALRARLRRADGTLERGTQIADVHRSGSALVAMNERGDAAVAYALDDSTLHSRQRPVGGGFARQRQLSDAGWIAENPQSLAVDDSGRAYVAWFAVLPSIPVLDWRVQINTRSLAGRATGVQNVSAQNDAATQISLAVRPSDGRAAIAFVAGSGPTWLRMRAPDGTLTNQQLLSYGSQRTWYPRVGIDDSGRAVAVWQVAAGDNTHLEARERSTRGTLSPRRMVSATNPGIGAPALGLGAGSGGAPGIATVVWLGNDDIADRIQEAVSPDP
jgi:hypothetical protein